MILVDMELRQALSSISFIFTSVNILLFFTIKELRTLFGRVCLYLLVSCNVLSLLMALGPHLTNNNPVTISTCPQAYIGVLLEMFLVFWTLIATVHMFLISLPNFKKSRILEVCYLAAGFGVPTLYVIGLAASDARVMDEYAFLTTASCISILFQRLTFSIIIFFCSLQLCHHHRCFRTAKNACIDWHLLANAPCILG